MCVYCVCGDQFSRWDPPFPDWHKQHPAIPAPVVVPPVIVPQQPWPLDKAKEYLDLLKEIRALEEKIGCPCEPNKADYIGLLEKLIERLKAEGSAP